MSRSGLHCTTGQLGRGQKEEEKDKQEPAEEGRRYTYMELAVRDKQCPHQLREISQC